MHWGSARAGSYGDRPGPGSTTVTDAAQSRSTTIRSRRNFSGGIHLRTPADPNAWLSTCALRSLVDRLAELNAQFSQSALSPVGGSQPHENMQPYLAVNFAYA